jgi:RNA polymerase-binding transcription factor DksA
MGMKNRGNNTAKYNASQSNLAKQTKQTNQSKQTKQTKQNKTEAEWTKRQQRQQERREFRNSRRREWSKVCRETNKIRNGKYNSSSHQLSPRIDLTYNTN